MIFSKITNNLNRKIKMSKISIIGAGHVGATIAYTLAMNDCAEKNRHH